MILPPDRIDIVTALTRLTELAEFELVSPAIPDPPPQFHASLAQAVELTKSFIGEIRPRRAEFTLTFAPGPHWSPRGKKR